MKQVYLDNNATTRIDPMVLEAMMPFLTEHYGNPSSIHDFGTPSRAALERAHQQVAALLGADHASEIIFTSCATEATSTALHACVELMPERREIITTAVEHPATLAVCEHLERQGYLIHRIGVNSDGALDMEQYRQALSSRVAVVSVMWANNETGVLFPVIEMAAMAQEYGALFHCDAVQVVGKIPLDIGRTQIDMLSCSAHKLHGPKGVGCLYLRRGTRFVRCCAAAIRSADAAPGRKTSPGLSAWAQPANWRRSICRVPPRWRNCAIGCRKGSSRRCLP